MLDFGCGVELLVIGESLHVPAFCPLSFQAFLEIYALLLAHDSAHFNLSFLALGFSVVLRPGQLLPSMTRLLFPLLAFRFS